MRTNDLQVVLDTADALGRRRILRDLPPTQDPVTLGVIARSLSDASPAVCEAAIEALTRSGGSTAVDAATPSLRSDDPAERGYALETLVRLGSAAVPTMTILLDDPDHDLRRYAAEALARVSSQSSLAALVVLLHDEDVTVAAAAAEGLGQLGSPEAIPALAESARDGSDWLRVASLYGLGEIGGRISLAHICATPRDASFTVLAVAVDAAGCAASAEPARALTFLAGLVAHVDPAVNDRVLTALGAILALQPPPSVPEQARRTIARAARLGLRSPKPDVRAASARCLGAAPESGSHDDGILFHELIASDEQVPVRLAALGALDARGGATPSTLATVVANTREDEDVRVAALRLMASDADASAANLEDLLVRVLAAGEPPLVRVAALRALVQVQQPEALRLGLNVLGDEGVQNDELSVAELLAYPLDIRLALAKKALDDAKPSIRRWTFTSLLPVAAAEAIRMADGGADLVTRAATDGDWSIRAHTFRLLQGEASLWARQLCRRACTDPEGRVRVRAVQAVGSVPADAGDVDVLRAHLTDMSDRVRVAALVGLTTLGHVDAVALGAAFQDTFPPMRHAALQAALHVVDDPDPTLRQQIAGAAFAAIGDDNPELARLGQELTQRLA